MIKAGKTEWGIGGGREKGKEEGNGVEGMGAEKGNWGEGEGGGERGSGGDREW